MRDIVIFGNGDQARTAFIHLSKDSQYSVAAFTAPAAHISTTTISDHCIIGAGALVMHDTTPEQVLTTSHTRVLPLKSNTLAKLMGKWKR